MLGGASPKIVLRKKRQNDSSRDYCKRSKQAHSNERNSAERSSSIGEATSSDAESLSSAESMITGTSSNVELSLDNSPHPDELDGLAEVVLKFDIDFDRQGTLRKDKLNEVLGAEIALRNTSGGIIQINSPQKVAVNSRDDWMKDLYEKQKTSFGSECGEKNSFDDILDIKTKDSTTYMFVRKSSVTILTDDSHLRQRSEERNYKVQLYSQICNVLNRRKGRCICANEAKFQTSFRLGDTLSYETIKEEHKWLKNVKSGNLAKDLCEKLSDNIVAFANTQGGTVYFGIKDTDASIKGQNIRDEEEKKDILRSIDECMKRKLWVLDSGERDDPKKGNHYHVKFFPVEGADANRFVIAVHICLYHGKAVFKKEPVCSVLNQDNQVVNMDFHAWLALHKPSAIGDERRKNKLKRRDHGRTVYFSVKNTIEDISQDLIEGSPGRIKIRPSNIIEKIGNQGLEKLMRSLNNIFKEKEWQGIAFIERCWRVNLGLENTKPSEVVCDVLVCSPNVPLVLVSLTEADVTRKSEEYNRTLATKLKRIMAEEGGCLEKVYVKPVVHKSSAVEYPHIVDEIISSTSSYPDAYQMSKEKYEAIINALVPVRARFNSVVNNDVGKELFDVLTKDQYEILFGNFESPKLMITGPPGSGKTILALERIRRLRRQGFPAEEILFVCSNNVLKEKVSRETVTLYGEQEPLCQVYNYFGVAALLKSECRRRDKLAAVKHILVDECQQFKEEPREFSFRWWKKFMDLYQGRNFPSLWVFSDKSQQIITEPCVLDSLPANEFSHRHLNSIIRTTGKIARFISERYTKDGPRVTLAHDFEGEDVEVLVPRSYPSNVRPEKRLVYMLISVLRNRIERGFDPDSIAVLFSDVKNLDHYKPVFIKHAGHCLVKNGKDSSECAVTFDTIRRYSGEEKDTIIGFCPEYVAGSGFQNNDGLMVSLCSRAKLKLILIIENEKSARSLKLTDCMYVRDIHWDKDTSNFKM